MVETLSHEQQCINDLLDMLRETVPAKSRGATNGRTNKSPPCWRTNRATEHKALVKAFARHQATTFEQRLALVNKMTDGFSAANRYRRAALGAKEFVSQPRLLSVWLNQDGGRDEFEGPITELRAQWTDDRCHIDGCGEPAVWRTENNQRICKPHYEETAPEILALKRMSEDLEFKFPRRRDESKRDWSLRILKSGSLGKALVSRWRGCEL